jgi:phosphoribosyl 1,2-cyclic phosphate phosphodiesterase
MRIVALGTGTSQGVPMIGCKCDVCLSGDSQDKRLRSSIYIETNEAKILIDIGPDFRTQFLSNNIDSIDMALITHEHNDHIIGLDDIRAINFTQKKSIPIYAEERVATQLKDRFAYAFNRKIPGLPKVDMINIMEFNTFTYKDVNISPVRVMHGRLPILAYRLNDLSYITDANYIDEASINKLRGSKVLIINALRTDPHPTHFNLNQALEMIEILNPDKAYITHVSHAMGLTKEWSKLLPDNVFALSDGMQINI